MSPTPPVKEPRGAGTPAFFPVIPTSSRSRSAAWIVLLTGLIITTMVTLYLKKSVDSMAEQEFTFECEELQNKIEERLHDQGRVLMSGVALFNASEKVTREKWRIFTTYLKFEKQLPGIQGVGFSLLIPRSELPRHVQEIRAEGFPEYDVRPKGEREVYTSIIYLEPFSGRNLRAFSYDMFSEPTRRAAMETARDTNAATLSGKVALVQENSEDVQAGTLMYMPVYRKGMPVETITQRRAALYGWVYSPHRMKDLMRGILGDHYLERKSHLLIQLFDGEQATPQNFLYESRPPDQNFLAATQAIRKIPINFNGTYWTLIVTERANGFFSGGYLQVWLAMTSGIAVTLLLLALTLTLLNTRDRSLSMAEGLTADLSESKEDLQEVLENSLDAHYKRNLQTGTYDYFSPVFQRISGYDMDVVTGWDNKSFFELVHPDDRQEIERVLAEAVFSATGTAHQIEYRFKHKDGRYRWFKDRFSVIQLTADQPLTLIGGMSDISENKQMEDALRETETRYRVLFTGAPYGILVSDEQTKEFQYANPALCGMFGYTEKEFTGLSVTDIHPIESLDRELAMLQDEKQLTPDIPCLRKDGTQFYANIVIVEMFMNGHACDVSFYTDITKKRKIEAELHHSQKLVALGVMAGGVAHEIRNPLAICSSSAQFLMEDDSSPEFRHECAEKIHLGIQRASLIIENLLRYSHPSTTTRKTRVDLVSLIRETQTLVAYHANIIKIVISSSFPEGPVMVSGVATLLQQVFMNLFLNAITAMPEGGRMGITVEQLHSEVRIQVTDSGCGIARREIGKIFDPFYTTSIVGQGTGLGLSLCYSIVKQHQGTIAVESAEGRGSVFTILLPAGSGGSET